MDSEEPASGDTGDDYYPSDAEYPSDEEYPILGPVAYDPDDEATENGPMKYSDPLLVRLFLRTTCLNVSLNGYREMLQFFKDNFNLHNVRIPCLGTTHSFRWFFYLTSLF